MSQEYHDLAFRPIYISKKKLCLSLSRIKDLIENELYEFKFEVTNTGDKAFPGGTLEFHGLPVDTPRPSLTGPPQTIIIGPHGSKIPTFTIPSLKPGETKKSSIDILEFYTMGTIKVSGTLESKDNLPVIYRRIGERRSKDSWPGTSSGYIIFLKINSHDFIYSKVILKIVIATLAIAFIDFFITWHKIALNWIFNILSKR